jgi:Beta-lactamase enzyme family
VLAPVALLGGIAVGVPAHAAKPPLGVGGGRSALLAAELRRAVDERNFKDVLDTTPPAGPPPEHRRPPVEEDDPSGADPARMRQAAAEVTARPIHQTPNLDVAVIDLDPAGRARSAADVLLSPRYPHGVPVPLNGDLATEQVRWRWWDDAEWNYDHGQGTRDVHGQGTRDVLPGREHAPLDFTSPYPASVLKLMVGFEVLRLVDAGRVALDADYAYAPVAPRPTCGGPVTKPIDRFFDEMITMSKNESTCALIKMIHDLGAMDDLNRTFAELGLKTLRLTGTDPGDGGHWIGSNMSAVDTARLLLLVNGGPGRLWTAPNGTPVTKDVLSDSARRFFLRTLGDQGHNDMLSTPNWCGRGYPAPGIPQRVPGRWIDPKDGTVTVDRAKYDEDVRPCNAVAEVTFAHKTGWIDTAGSDAGIVHSLPGRARRDYIVVAFSNLGTEYIDVNRPPDPPGSYPVLYTEKLAQLGLAIDDILRARGS